MKIRRNILILVPVAAVLALAVQLLRMSHPRMHGFSSGGFKWSQYGGAWQLKDDVMWNVSTERGAKLLTGNSRWNNYRVEADVALVGSNGDAGIIVRAQKPERGVDSYEGYFAGLRTLDNTMIFGRADYGWKEYVAEPIPQPLVTKRFYHLEVVAVGCRIAAVVTLPDNSKVRSGVDLTRCSHAGQVGLKSYQTPAEWKNFEVMPATEADLGEAMAGQALASAKANTLHRGVQTPNERIAVREEAISHQIEGSTVPIGQLRVESMVQPEHVAIHGVVRLLSPMIVVEDLTGGLTLVSNDAAALAIGDEIEVTGDVSRVGNHLVMSNGHVKSLWSNDTAAPSMVAAAEAATGEHDDQLVVLDGTLLREWVDSGNHTVLELRSGGEVFRALLDQPPFATQIPRVPVMSELQLTGVVRSDRRYSGDTAFAMLLTPADDAVRVLREAPWWNREHEILVGLGVVFLLGAALSTYIVVKQKYLMNIVEERERLAHDLHDTVSQSFAGIGYQLSGVKERLEPDSSSSVLLDRAQNMVKDTHEELRRSITTLRANATGLNDIGSALEAVARRLVGEGPLVVTSTTAGVRMRLPLSVADCFFRVGQEAISNALMHANATKIAIEMIYEANQVKLLIQDDGCGLRPGKDHKGIGLFGMHRRAAMAGVRLNVTTEKTGTTISLEADLAHPPLLHRLLSRPGI